MTFRNSDPKPLAYLVGDAGLVTECRLVELHPNHLIGFAPELPTLDRTLPVTLRLSLNDTPTDERPGVPARIQGRSLGKDNYVIQIERPEAFWVAATANQTQNRRQAFRVRSEEFGFDRPSSNMEVSAQIEQGPLRLTGEIMNLSLSGCNL
ncbi:MAG: hypothetical protein P1V35_15540, partial [Planctomycetota bacterium]|nr:hypothetical protein [Planctomycetota bacterium]